MRQPDENEEIIVEESAEDEASLLRVQKERALTLLSCLRTPADLDRLDSAGVTLECFKPFDNYAEVFQYILNRLAVGKPIQRSDVRNVYNVELLTGVSDVGAYAEQVMVDFRQRAVIKAVEQYQADAERKGVTQAIRDLKNKLSYITINMNHKVDVLLSGRFEEPDPLTWLIDDILPSKWPTFFYGRGGVAKSYLLLTMACHVALGLNFMGRRTTKANVLYVDWEMDGNEYHTRLSNVCRGFEFGDPIVNERGKTEWEVEGLKYYNTKAPLSEKMADIHELIAEHDIGLVIIDSFGYSMGEGKEIEKSGHALDYMRILGGIKCSVAVIDHVSKVKEADGTPFGSVYKLNSCRWAWWLTAVSNPEAEDNGGQEFEPGTYQRWRNMKHNMAARQKDFFTYFQWEKDEDGRFSFYGRPILPENAPPELVGPVKKKTEDIRPGGSEDLILEFLYLNPDWYTHSDIAEATEQSLKTTKAACDSLYRKNRIDRSERKTGGRNAYIYRVSRNAQGKDVKMVDIGEEDDLDL